MDWAMFLSLKLSCHQTRVLLTWARRSKPFKNAKVILFCFFASHSGLDSTMIDATSPPGFTPVRQPIDLNSLASYLCSLEDPIFPSGVPLQAWQANNGMSNPTYLVSSATKKVIVRRKPLGMVVSKILPSLSSWRKGLTWCPSNRQRYVKQKISKSLTNTKSIGSWMH